MPGRQADRTRCNPRKTLRGGVSKVNLQNFPGNQGTFGFKLTNGHVTLSGGCGSQGEGKTLEDFLKQGGGKQLYSVLGVRVPPPPPLPVCVCVCV